MFGPQLIHKTVAYLFVLIFSLAISGCQSENNSERLRGNPIGVDSTQGTSNSTSQTSSSATSNTTSTNTTSTNSSNTTSSSSTGVQNPSSSDYGSSSNVRTPITPRRVAPLSSDHYEWQKGVFKYQTEYSNRCVFPQTEKDAKGTMLDELFAWRDIVKRTYLLSDEVIDLDPRKYVKPFSDYDSYVEVMTNNDSYLQKLRSFIPKESEELKHGPYEIKDEVPMRNSNGWYKSGKNVFNWYNSKLESFTFGIEWKRFSDTIPRDFRVKFILKNSPASKAIIDGLRIKRGDILLKVNNIDFVNNSSKTTSEQILEALKPKKINESIRLTFKDKDTNRNKSIVLKSFKEDETNDLHVSRIIETESGNVGYLHIGESGHQIVQYNAEIEKFRKNHVKDVIVDMRYFNEREHWWNESRAESSLAFMIVGNSKTRFSNETFWTLNDRTGREHKISDGTEKWYRARVKFKSKRDKENLKLDTRAFHFYDDVVFNNFCLSRYESGMPDKYYRCTYTWYERVGTRLAGTTWKTRDAFFQFFVWASSKIPFSTLNLNRVFILISRETCSMAEAFINAFRGVDVDVILVGENTCGDPYARREYVNCGISIDLINSMFVNQKLFGDYEEGFKPQNSPSKHGVSVPGCYVKDDLTKPLGDKDEALLAAALQYRDDKTCPPVK